MHWNALDLFIFGVHSEDPVMLGDDNFRHLDDSAQGRQRLIDGNAFLQDLVRMESKERVVVWGR